jgi:hypothetical protein
VKRNSKWDPWLVHTSFSYPLLKDECFHLLSQLAFLAAPLLTMKKKRRRRRREQIVVAYPAYRNLIVSGQLSAYPVALTL